MPKSIIKNCKPEHFEMTLFIDENEQYILNRLKREGRNGTIEKLQDNIYKYSINIFDTNELTTWIKTFVGRIIEIKGDNKSVINHFYCDIKRMKRLYNNG